ncbi:MAG TPA: FHA domain-containing protein [Verrucomicrobiae bacterium]|jgi:pSer/pThr/pTyr-binding forkhead associated (FHA) protein|nr:FHA domain-containing protein [Verrucomicrobiae bacterium]
MPKLVVLSEGLTGRSHELKVEKTTIGRLEDNAFQIAEQSVSSHHCEILLKGNDVVVKDLNSTNGTYINGEKISEKPLKAGQILRLGSIEVRLEGDPGAAPTPEKKKMDPNTRVIPRGVKLNEFEQGATGVKFDKNSPFAKKSNKTNLIFIVVGVVLGLAIISFLVLAFLKMHGE